MNLNFINSIKSSIAPTIITEVVTNAVSAFEGWAVSLAETAEQHLNYFLDNLPTRKSIRERTVQFMDTGLNYLYGEEAEAPATAPDVEITKKYEKLDATKQEEALDMDMERAIQASLQDQTLEQRKELEMERAIQASLQDQALEQREELEMERAKNASLEEELNRQMQVKQQEQTLEQALRASLQQKVQDQGEALKGTETKNVSLQYALDQQSQALQEALKEQEATKASHQDLVIRHDKELEEKDQLIGQLSKQVETTKEAWEAKYFDFATQVESHLELEEKEKNETDTQLQQLKAQVALLEAQLEAMHNQKNELADEFLRGCAELEYHQEKAKAKQKKRLRKHERNFRTSDAELKVELEKLRESNVVKAEDGSSEDIYQTVWIDQDD